MLQQKGSVEARFAWVLALCAGLVAALPAAAGIPLDPSFPGIGLVDQVEDLSQSAWPPSPNAAAGPNHHVLVTNQSMAIFTKSGQRLSHVRLRDFLRLKQKGVTYQATFDPRLLYDAPSGRWFLACISSGAGQTGQGDPVLLAVSRSADPTGPWSTFLLPVGEPPVGNDFKAAANLTLGVDAQGVYLGMRIVPAESAAFAKIVATPKAPLVAKRPRLGALTQLSNLTGVVASPQPAQSLDDSAEDGWAVASIEGRGSDVRVWRITWSGNTPSLSSPTDVSTDAFGEPVDTAQNGSAEPIEVGDERMLSAVIRNGHLWTSRTIGLNSTGGSSSPDRSGVEWFQLDLAGGAPTVADTGLVFDSNTPARDYFQPVISANARNDAVIAFNTSSAQDFVNANWVFRLDTDPPGTTSGVGGVKQGEDTYERTVGGDLLPWGRYGSVSVDPNDDFSFWIAEPYAADSTEEDGAWGTWIGRVQTGTPPDPEPTIAKVKPAALSFGKKKIGTTKRRTVTITNKGDSLLLGEIGAPAAPFTVTEGGGLYALQPKEKRRVVVEFTPDAAGAFTGTLEITTNDPAQAVVAIGLTGTGK